MDLPLHPGAVGGDKQVVLSVALDQPALGKAILGPALRDEDRPNLRGKIFEESES